MTQRRRTSKAKAKRRFGRRAFLAGAGAAACAATGWYLRQKSDADHTAASGQDTPPAPNPALPAGEWRAVWVSYLDWALLDFSTEDTFRAGAAQLLDNCAGLGLNTVLAQVRPFGDALYRSSLFPWSHLCTGVQGKDPGFDPLDVFLTEAHRRGIGVEAWVNPYRLRSSAAMPPNLAENNLANTHPDWLCTAGEGLYLNPAVPAAADYVVQGVAELLQNYPVDGIHFDDYFYPTTDAAVDAVQFAASGAADLAAWRRQNVTALVAKVHRTVKAADPTLRFGISPQGNPDNDLDQQYSDVTAWLAAGGEEKVIDYLCPQVYWGYGFTLHSGSTRFAFENIVPAWLGYPRAGDVALYFGLGAYRVGTGDGGANPDSVSGWSPGSALAAQVQALRQQAAGGEEKVIDYLCPQVYWGYGFTLHSGSTRFAFENIVPAWLAYPRAGDVALYFGLGAYRVGTGDGGANPDSVSGWSTGSALAAQVKDLRQQAAGGWALYRYGSLFGAEAPALAEAECAALRALNG